MQCFLITLGTEVVLKSYPHRSPFYVISLQSSYGSFLGTTCLTTCLKTSISEGFWYPLRLLLAAKCIPNPKNRSKMNLGDALGPKLAKASIFDLFLELVGEPLGALSGKERVKVWDRFLTQLFYRFFFGTTD